MTTPTPSKSGSIVAINMHLFAAVVCAVIARAAWPTSPEWWGMGVVSILFGMAALASVAAAIGGMKSLYLRERELSVYMAQGGPPKSAKLADHERLRKAGMIE
jgi:hypothetical protein